MHCDACKKLILMEFTEHNLDQYVDHISEIEKNQGTVYIKDTATKEDIEQMKQLVRDMGSYTAL